MVGTLYLVATPIGNLADITLRALDVLKEVNVVACEDTRVTDRLFKKYGLLTKTISFHEHSPRAQTERILSFLTDGQDVALVSDAGTPLLSDPGSRLVEEASALGITVSPLPGPSAITSALVASGIQTHPFLFLAFPPRKESDRRRVLSPHARASYTVVLFESPRRLPSLLDTLIELFGGQRRACVARELSKRFEEFSRGSLQELREKFGDAPKGEVTVVVAPAAEEALEEGIEDLARRALLEGQKLSDAARDIAAMFGKPKKEIYALLMSLKNNQQ